MSRRQRKEREAGGNAYGVPRFTRFKMRSGGKRRPASGERNAYDVPRFAPLLAETRDTARNRQ